MLDLKQAVVRKIGIALAILALTATAFGSVALASANSPTGNPQPVAPTSRVPDDDATEGDSDDGGHAGEQSSTKDDACDGADEDASEHHDEDNVEDHDDNDE